MNERDKKLHMHIGKYKGGLLRRVAAMESKQIRLTGTKDPHPICDVDSCYNSGNLRLVDDNGVDVFLCEEHYKQFRAFERERRKALRKAGFTYV